VADEAKGFLLDAMEEMDLEALRTTIRVAKSRGVDKETLDAAQARVGVVIEMIAAKEELFEAIADYDVGRLQDALEETERLELDEFIPDRTLDDASARLEFLGKRFDAEAKLRAAMAATHVANLRAAIQGVAIFHSSEELLQQADVRLNVLLAEIEASKVALTEAMRGIDTDQLEAAIVEAGRLLVDQETITAANNRLDSLFISQGAEEDLLAAVQGEDRAALASMLAEARSVGIGIDASLRTAAARVVELDQMAEAAATQLAQKVVSTDTEGLRTAIARALSLDAVDSAAIATAKEALHHLEEIDEATKNILEAADGHSMGWLQRTLRRGRELGLSADVLNAGEDGANRLRRRMHDAEVNMKRLTATGTNADELEAAITEVKLLNAAAHNVINAAQAKLDQLRR